MSWAASNDLEQCEIGKASKLNLTGLGFHYRHFPLAQSLSAPYAAMPQGYAQACHSPIDASLPKLDTHYLQLLTLLLVAVANTPEKHHLVCWPAVEVTAANGRCGERRGPGPIAESISANVAGKLAEGLSGWLQRRKLELGEVSCTMSGRC